MWMAFRWKGQEVFIKGNDPVSTEIIRLEQLNGLLCSTSLVSEINLCSLRSFDSQEHEKQPTSTWLQPCIIENTTLATL